MDTEGLSVICSGLVSYETDEYGRPLLNEDGNFIYYKEKYCLDNLKDLLRFLRRDDPDTRDVFKQVCKWDVAGKYLIPIFEYFQDDRNLVLNAVKILVFITMPIESSSKDANQQLEYLWGIKSAITSSDVIAVIVSLLEKPLENLECMAFSEDDWKLVQLVLTVFRNILAVQDISVHQKGSANQLLSLRDNFLEQLFKESVMDLFIIITQHAGGSCPYLRHDNFLLLEIFHYIFMGQDPEVIAKASMGDSKGDGHGDGDEVSKAGLDSLESIMKEEAAKKRQARLHASRHSQCGASFTRLTLDGSKTMCKGTPTSATRDQLLKMEKVHRGRSQKIMKDYAQAPTTKRSLLETLHDFLNQFLTGGYNVLMQSIITDIEKEHHAIETSDVLMFFHLAQFATSYQYHKSVLTKHNVEAKFKSSHGDDDDDDNDDESTWFKGNICGPIAATMNESMFGLVIAKWQLAFEGLKETKNNSFLSVSGSLMKIMIRMLDLVLKLMPESSKEPQTVRTILYKLFYDQTDQGLTQFLLNMVRVFDAHKQPKSDLANLVEIIHVVIRLMEKLQAHGTLRVAKKARKVHRKQKVGPKSTESGTVGDDVAVQKEEQCSVDAEHPDGGIPEKENSPLKVHDGKDENVDGIPEKENSTQAACVESDKNVDVSIPIDKAETSMTEGKNTGNGLLQNDEEETNQNHEKPLETGVSDCDSSADEEAAATAEVDFQMRSWLINFASNSIISNLCWLLKFYKSNSIAINHYLVSLLRRICDDLDLAPMLYQLSCLVIFYEIMDDQKARPQKEYENLAHFLTSLVRRMLRKMKNQPLLFVDLLFWKTRKECQYINLESMHREVGEMRKEVRNWGSGDAGPSRPSEGVRKSLADALGDDEYDVTVSRKPHYEMDLDLNDADDDHQSGVHEKDHTMKDDHGEGKVEGAVRKKRRLVLNGKLEEQIRSLYEKYKDSLDCCKLIATALDMDGTISPAQVSRNCKKLGLQLPSRKGVKMEATLEAEISPSDPNNPNGSSISKKPSQTRKRIRAIDENLEPKIRSLFEQFKEHKRCSYMIAKELEPIGTVTAAQVSRKLKKLGLHTSKMRGDSTKLKMDEDHENDASTDDDDDLDNLTLSSLRKRNKNNEDASLFSKEMGKSNAIHSPEHSSDDDLVLSTISKISRRSRSEPEDIGAKTPTTLGFDSEEQNSQGLDEREDKEQTEAMDTDIETRHLEHKATSDQALDDEATDNPVSSGEEKGLSLKEPAYSTQNEHQVNELEDSDDELRQSNASPKSSVSRRKLRVVLDFDDDE